MYKEETLLKFSEIYHFHLFKFLYFFYFGKHFSPLLPNDNYSNRNIKINFQIIRLQNERNLSVYWIC